MPVILLLVGDAAPVDPRRGVAHRARRAWLFGPCSSRSRTLPMRVDRAESLIRIRNLAMGIRIPVAAVTSQEVR